ASASGKSVADIDIATSSSSDEALGVIDNALQQVSDERAKLGALQNRLDHTVSNLTNIVTNTQASRSRIMDTDYAAETSNLAKAQIIQQAATAMLAQANQSAQSVLSLLQ
ncbi:MAG: flagellin, partial [Burkholderiaceae bacterium]